jgi:hypothetical protein
MALGREAIPKINKKSLPNTGTQDVPQKPLESSIIILQIPVQRDTVTAAYDV